MDCEIYSTNKTQNALMGPTKPNIELQKQISLPVGLASVYVPLSRAAGRTIKDHPKGNRTWPGILYSLYTNQDIQDPRKICIRSRINKRYHCSFFASTTFVEVKYLDKCLGNFVKVQI